VALDAFTARLGIDQGRLVRPDGTIAFVLGSLAPGYESELAVGDYAEVVQLADLTNVDLVRVEASLAVGDVPDGVAWELSLRLDGAPQASVRARPNRTHRTRDLAANVSSLGGTHEIAVRLELVVS